MKLPNVHKPHEKKKPYPLVNMYAIIVVSLVCAAGIAFVVHSIIVMIVSFFIFLVLFSVYVVLRKKMKRDAEIHKMENAFPDFIELMSSNLRAGMTIDRALLTSSRKEFAPLDKEILNLGKSIMTGVDISAALLEMSQRIGSEKIRKIVLLIDSGIKAGGNLSVLLEQTATHMREREFVEKRAASNVLMYVIFIFFAVAIGAPLLFSLSSVLVEILTKLLSGLPATQQSSLSLPFAITSINISVNFVIYFAAIFLTVIDILASLILGLVSKGNEKDGVRYMLPLIGVSLSVFFVSRIFLLKYFGSFVGGG